MLKKIFNKMLGLNGGSIKNKGEMTEMHRSIEELVFASCFQSTICDSVWLVNKTFSPGRWAVGYPFLYVMYRVLNEIKPKKIVELGLGQSTRMICQYVDFYQGVTHHVVEHDEKWISFFKRQYFPSSRTEIVKLDWDYIPFNESPSVRVYKDFANSFSEKKFDLVVIDGPLGGDMKRYSRIDILRLMPECLEKEFVILLDDYERDAEMRTADLMCKCLEDNGIEYSKGVYRGAKDMVVICSKSYGFLVSM